MMGWSPRFRQVVKSGSCIVEGTVKEMARRVKALAQAGGRPVHGGNHNAAEVPWSQLLGHAQVQRGLMVFDFTPGAHTPSAQSPVGRPLVSAEW